MSKITISKPDRRWLFYGVGFHNSEATMLNIMNDKFKNEIALKTFNEISPTYTRVFAGFHNWTKEAMDSFCDYYDKTFRKKGTLVYMVPGRMPIITDDFDIDDYAEKVACNLEYLVKERNCTKLRYYCATNELSMGNTYAYLSDKLDLLKKIHASLYKAFSLHNLDIGLMATDSSGVDKFHHVKWASENMDEITQCYCAHLYSDKYKPGDLEAYSFYYDNFSMLVSWAHKKEKRFILGEYGIIKEADQGKVMPMRKDVCYSEDVKEDENLYAIAVLEMAMSAINAGVMSAVFWTMFDYPDPFIREDGDTKEEKARYDVARFSGHGLDIRYNKHGLIRWNDEENDYSSRASLYTMGYLAKLFKKGSRVMKCDWDDEYIRASSVTNPDNSVSIAIINWKDEDQKVSISLEHKCDKPLRCYKYNAYNVPYNKFNDLQPYSEIIDAKNGEFEIKLDKMSVCFLTTDYVDRIPSDIRRIKYKKGKLSWKKCKDKEHAYYRVYLDGEQIASTVAEYLYTDKKGDFKVLSVDKYGNSKEVI